MSPHTAVTALARWRRWLPRRPLALAFSIASLATLSAIGLTVVAGVSSASAHSATLRVGSTGSAVKQLQRRLHVQATGYYGSLTQRAVKRFQRSHHLKADGVAGPATLRALGVRASAAAYSGGAGGVSAGGSSSSSRTRIPAALQRIARCESGGNPRAVSPSGRYRGKYQFDRATWKRWGGTGDPAAASEAVQDRIALKLYRARGTAPWPNCGR